ncbi:hypothetical protein JQ557_03155 [Bradyrhizobium sp. U87765 SZCCT0131]|uniref:hypothetical protein n=1 Tax=unclassified Bradyrhizobium TaxID=2631580 RepID=UPI001BAD7181|nr:MULTISPECIES: hypothetical protein [unclassified Bradyrhizobium]MBR1216972.1 hypothetical protein [Bradyrhizobium sp. U87765 SZCCT0131]MBR1259272.1 hypothetical protein [Bradyrhizobium sp. U87765 SZCCT0134]MBR1305413.1 hypothetical protein [Bradyrhizobium sp. U87765 SZCCT0110]MBR1321199.1 hypothetical protein [Bradyrhizobium sp. U87765 SZCCT0109]MBR1350147.1 hypothetical protein [Bradyrhizobium sp. U87765 SZCCT0048]
MKKILGMFAVAGLLAVAAPVGSAQALSLANPAAAAATKTASEHLGMTTEVRWHHRHWRGHRWHHHRHWRHRHWRHHHRRW